jgi:hypothetical protein
MAWHLTHSFDRTRIEANQIDLSSAYFIGSGAAAARSVLSNQSNSNPFGALRTVIDDVGVRDVGGVPQLAMIGRDGLRVFGVVKSSSRFLFGREVKSSGHARNVQYIAYDIDDVPPLN